jgi:hypothetical protein
MLEVLLIIMSISNCCLSAASKLLWKRRSDCLRALSWCALRVHWVALHCTTSIAGKAVHYNLRGIALHCIALQLGWRCIAWFWHNHGHDATVVIVATFQTLRECWFGSADNRSWHLLAPLSVTQLAADVRHNAGARLPVQRLPFPSCCPWQLSRLKRPCNPYSSSYGATVRHLSACGRSSEKSTAPHAA